MTGSSLRLSMVSERGAGQLPWDSGCSRDAGLGEGHVGSCGAASACRGRGAGGGRRQAVPGPCLLVPDPPSTLPDHPGLQSALPAKGMVTLT